MARDESKPVLIRYDRDGDRVRFALANVDEQELRTFIVALWLVLEGPSRLDMIRELSHYHHESPHADPPPVARAIADAYAKARR